MNRVQGTFSQLPHSRWNLCLVRRMDIYIPTLVKATSCHMLRPSHQQVNGCLKRLPGEKCQEQMLLSLMRLKKFSFTGGDSFLIFLFPHENFNCCIFTLIIQNWFKNVCYNHLNSEVLFKIISQVCFGALRSFWSPKIIKACFRDVGLATAELGRVSNFA